MKIAILEDEMIVVKDLTQRLSEMGYEVVASFAEGEALIAFLTKNHVDLLLVDINLKGRINGIETVKAISSLSKAPIIYITAQADRNTFNEAKDTKPAAYLVKPYNDFDLETTVELALENHINEEENDVAQYIVDDQVFVRNKNRFEKIDISDILYMEAAGNYTDIITAKGKYVVTTKLGQLEGYLSKTAFFRCHRSYMVNIKEVDGFDDMHVYIKEIKIPISKNGKKGFLDRLRVI